MNNHIAFEKKLHHNHYIWMASFLHELIQYAHLAYFFKKRLYHTHYIWKTPFLSELIQYAYSSHLFQKSLNHRCCIEKAFFYHELIQYAHLDYFFRKICITHITFERFLSFMNYPICLFRLLPGEKSAPIHISFLRKKLA